MVNTPLFAKKVSLAVDTMYGEEMRSGVTAERNVPASKPILIFGPSGRSYIGPLSFLHTVYSYPDRLFSFTLRIQTPSYSNWRFLTIKIVAVCLPK